MFGCFCCVPLFVPAVARALSFSLTRTTLCALAAEPRHGDPLRAEKVGPGGEKVRAHAQLHVVRDHPHNVVHPGELPDADRRNGSRG